MQKVRKSKYGVRGGLIGRKSQFSIEIMQSAVNEYFNTKKPFSEIGKEYGVSGGSIREWVIKMGLKPKRRRETQSYSFEFKSECLKLYNTNLSVNEIKNRFGVSRRTVLSWVKELGGNTKTFQERIGITQKMKERGIKLYVEDGLNASEVSRIIGVSNNTIRYWVKKQSVLKTHSEIMAKLVSVHGSINSRGNKGTIETRFGLLRFDSWYERDRIKQLVNDIEVVNLARCQDLIPYEFNGVKRNYNPDFFIEYVNGKKVVEEIKPNRFVNKFNNREKFSAAKILYKEKGIKYKVILENIIYGKRIA